MKSRTWDIVGRATAREISEHFGADIQFVEDLIASKRLASLQENCKIVVRRRDVPNAMEVPIAMLMDDFPELSAHDIKETLVEWSQSCVGERDGIPVYDRSAANHLLHTIYRSRISAFHKTPRGP